MKKILKILIVGFVIYLAAVRFSNYFFEEMAGDKAPSEVEYNEVKNFSFQTESDLKEWDEKRLSSKRTKYSIADLDGQKCLKADSNDSASALFHKEAVSIKKWPYVSWEWIVKKFPEREDPENIDQKEEFDFAAQFYVIFDAKFFLSAKAIQYVWLKDFPVGSVFDNPYTKNVKIMVLGSGPSDGWKMEKRNVRDDYETLFGEPPAKNIAAISLMSDSDSTGTAAESFFKNVSFGYIDEKTVDGEDEGKTKENTEKKTISSYLKCIFKCSKNDYRSFKRFISEKINGGDRPDVTEEGLFGTGDDIVMEER